VISRPDGKTTLVLLMVALLWQATQSTTVVTGAAASTLPASLPSTPRKSW